MSDLCLNLCLVEALLLALSRWRYYLHFQDCALVAAVNYQGLWDINLLLPAIIPPDNRRDWNPGQSSLPVRHVNQLLQKEKHMNITASSQLPLRRVVVPCSSTLTTAECIYIAMIATG